VGRHEPVVDQRHHEGQERCDQGAGHDAADEVPGHQRQRQQDEAEHDVDHDQDQEHQHIGAEHVPCVPADGPPALAERAEDAFAADHDAGHDQRPEGQQDQPGDDDQDETDRDPDTGQDGRDDHREQVRQDGGDRFPQVQVRPPVPDVLNGLDQRGLHQEGGYQVDDQAEERADCPGQGQQRHDDRGAQIDRESDQQEVGGEALVVAPGLAKDPG
jgi:hypothetical protein